MTNEELKRLNISKGKSSYSQERIWLGEPIRTMLVEKNEELYNSNSVLVYPIENGYFLIKRFRQTLKSVIDKLDIFRTTLEYDSNERCFQQKIIFFNDENSYSLNCSEGLMQ